MDKLYTRVNWHNLPNTTTPINETNLNNMDNAIDLIDSRVVAMDTDLSTNYLSKTDGVTSVTYSEGELHVTKNGTTVDTAISSGSAGVTDVSYNTSTGVLSVTEDGTTTTYQLTTPYTPTSVQATLSSSDWSNKQQTVTVQGMTANANGFIGLDISATSTQREAARDALISLTGQATNSITVTADGDVPSVNIPINVLIM